MKGGGVSNLMGLWCRESTNLIAYVLALFKKIKIVRFFFFLDISF